MPDRSDPWINFLGRSPEGEIPTAYVFESQGLTATTSVIFRNESCHFKRGSKQEPYESST
jgi:hypothetical protein